MKKILAALALALCASIAQAQTYSLFKPANGVLKGSTATYVTTAATSADILALWSGSCSSSTFLRGDGACASAGGGGGSPGGSSTNVQYNLSGSFAGDANFTWDHTAQLLTLTGTGGGFNTAFQVTGPVNPAFELNDTAGAPWLFSSTSGVFKLGILNGGGSYGGVGLLITGNTGSRNITDASLEASGSHVLGITSNGEVNLNGSVGTATNCLTSGGTGSAATWASCGGGGGSPGGSNTQVQYNNSGSFGGSSRFTWTDSTAALTLTHPSTGPFVQYNDPTGFTWKVGTDGAAGNFQFVQTVAGTHTPLSLLPTGGINVVGAVQMNANAGNSGQALTSAGSSSQAVWADSKAVAKTGATATNASAIGVGAQYCIQPTSTVTVTSSTTFADDSDLELVNVPAGAYRIDAHLEWTFTNATGGVKAQIVIDGGVATGPTYSGVAACNNAAADVAVSLNGSTPFSCTGATGTDAMLNVSGFIVITSTANPVVQWAQQTSNGTGTVRAAYGQFCLTRLN